ncbi:hypothetical protein J25TS5_10620 [Paenibacillus faecis]|uniref:helix-turn-helix domain-containing protein n=1 Tax=Paenibacillus faecis TaxID=862114 RepID=UPI001B2AC51A|nr:hypothetical protein J25TS5_10620 [Paenibacillus faecis]
MIKDRPGIILENALRLFGEKGYESTTVDEIAVSIRYGTSRYADSGTNSLGLPFMRVMRYD